MDKEVRTLLLWALEHTTKEPLCEHPEVNGVCDFTFEISGKEYCPCQWRVIFQAERKADFIAGNEPVEKDK